MEEQNYAEAARLFREAAAQGHDEAQLSLGGLFLHGEGVTRDWAEASRLLWLAARQGNGRAREALAELASERAYVTKCCGGCGATRKLKTCARCEVARFCGPECVKKAWAEHKPHCQAWAAEAEAAAEAP